MSDFNFPHVFSFTFSFSLSVYFCVGVGDITESDVKLAETFSAHIYGFNVSLPEKLKALCKSSKVDYVLTNIIYRMIEAMKKDIENKLPPNQVEEVTGEANVLAVFNISEGKKKIPVAGSRCVKGTLTKSCMFRLIRDEEVLFDGKWEQKYIQRFDAIA